MTAILRNDQYATGLFLVAIFLMPLFGAGNWPWLVDAPTATLVWEIFVLLTWAFVTVTRPIGFKSLIRCKWIWPLWGFAAWTIVILPFAEVFDSAWRQSMLWLTVLLLAQTAIQLQLSRRAIVGAISAFFIAAAIGAAYGIYQGVWGFSSLSQMQGLSADDLRLLAEVQRPFGFFPGANVFGGFLSAMLPLALLIVLWKPSQWRIALVIIGYLLIFVGMLFSFSRGAWLCFFIGLFPLALAIASSRFKKRIIVGFLIFFSLSYVFFLGLQFEADPERSTIVQSVIDRFYSLGTGSNASVFARIGYWETGLRMGADHFPLGAGTGNFAKLARQYQALPNYTRSAHNFPIQLFAEQGVLGVLIFLWLLVSVWRARQSWPVDERENRLIANLITVSLFIMLLHGLIDFDFDSPAIFGAFWLFCSFLWLPNLPKITHLNAEEGAIPRTLVATIVVLVLFAGQFLPFLGGRYYELSVMAGETNAREKSLDLNKSAMMYWPFDPLVMYRQSRLLFKRYMETKDPKELADSEMLIQDAIAGNPANPDFYHGYADILALKGNQSEALKQLEEAKNVYPTSIYYRTEYARGLALSGNRAKALKEINLALTLEDDYLLHANPNGMDLFYARFLRASILIEQEKWEEAIEEYNHIVNLCHRDGLVINAFTSSRHTNQSCADLQKQAKEYAARARSNLKRSNKINDSPEPSEPDHQVEGEGANQEE